MSPVFVTLSAADMQWQDLHRHFPGFADVATADDRLRRTFIWDGVQSVGISGTRYVDIAHVLSEVELIVICLI
jgi:hypothetical protein